MIFLALFSKVNGEDEKDFEKWIVEEYNPKVADLMAKEVFASWNYETNLTDQNQHIMVSSSIFYQCSVFHTKIKRKTDSSDFFRKLD